MESGLKSRSDFAFYSNWFKERLIIQCPPLGPGGERSKLRIRLCIFSMCRSGSGLGTLAGVPTPRSDIRTLTNQRNMDPRKRLNEEMKESASGRIDAATTPAFDFQKWISENRCCPEESMCLLAAESGRLEALQWAREKGCPWDERTCAYAARGGHLEMLKWARENGCPWDVRTCSGGCFEWTFGGVEVGQGQHMSLGLGYVRFRCQRRTFGCVEVGQGKGMSLGLENVHGSCFWRTFGGVEVGQG